MAPNREEEEEAPRATPPPAATLASCRAADGRCADPARRARSRRALPLRGSWLRRIDEQGRRNGLTIERLHERDEIGLLFAGQHYGLEERIFRPTIGRAAAAARVVIDDRLERRLLSGMHVRRSRCDAAQALRSELAGHRRRLREAGELSGRRVVAVGPVGVEGARE